MSLYNAKKLKDHYQITKFDDELEVESSYNTSSETCDCPAGVRDTCRHRQMLPEFVEADRYDSSWFFDWDNRRWFYYDTKTGRILNAPPKPSWRRI